MNIFLEVFNKEVDPKYRRLVDEPVNEDLIDKNKYANNSQYVPDSVYRRLLNKMTNYQWSFVPHWTKEYDDYIEYVGLLVVPGFGVHTGVGTAKKSKKDNSNALAAAKTYAFKNACKEMGLAPNVGDKDWDEELFEEDVDLDEEEFDMTEEDKPKKKSKKKEEKKPAKKKKMSTKERIEEVRDAYELEDEDDFVAFIQIWNEEILELEDMEEDDWEVFLDYLEKNKDEFEEF